MSDFLADFLRDFGYGGAESGADIARMAGVTDPRVLRESGLSLDPLFATTKTGLAKLPELLSTLTGQVEGRFQTGRAGIQQRGVELGRAGRAGIARAGFAGGGAIQRTQRAGRRQLGQQFMGILGARETGLFGAGQRVESERAGLLGSLGGGIQNLLNALISGEVQFGGAGGGGGRPGGPPLDIPREEPIDGYGGEDVDYGNWRTYRQNGGTLGYQDWVARGSPEYDYMGGG